MLFWQAFRHLRARSNWLWPRNRQPAPRIAIVTAVCGNRDVLQDPSIFHADVDYHAFVDRPFPCKVWTQHAALQFSTDARFAARRHSRMCKILPQLFLPGYEFHIWVDATHEVVASPVELIESAPDH